MENYEKLLEEAYSKIKKPELNGNGKRFEVPKVEGHFEGKKTILTNFYQIAAYLRRSPEQFQKFMLRELAAQGQREGDRLILNIKVPSTKINQKVKARYRTFKRRPRDFYSLFGLWGKASCKKQDLIYFF